MTISNLTGQALQQRCINTIRTLAIDAVQKANSGHPGMPMDAAPMAYILWTRFLRHNPADPGWPDRDRFVLSAGHASMLLYSLLYLTGYDLSLDDLKSFRQWDSRTPGHPEHGRTPGVELTTGPLGQGFAMGVGMAIAERFLGEHFNKPGVTLVDHWTYAIVSDGDMMEGISSEAASLAGTLGLGKLVYLYDDNNISIEGNTDIAFREQVSQRFQAYGWHVQRADGNDVDGIAECIEAARAETERPSLIIVSTEIAYGSPHKHGSAAAHGSPLGEEEVRLTKEALGWPAEPAFFVPDEALAEFRKAVERGREWQDEWNDRFAAYESRYPDDAASWRSALSGTLPAGWDAGLPRFTAGESTSTRAASGKVLNALAANLPTLIGGSADLAPSTSTYLRGYGDFEADEWCGHNMHFGVREHAMGGIVNGMARHGGVIPYGATFLVFSDYMRPSLRIAALMQAPSYFIFTHDSIGLGEDGPTHQPVEHLASLRAMPNLTVLRPADANETVACWRLALHRNGPVALVLTRQDLPVLGETDRIDAGVPRGGYVLADAPDGRPDVMLIATGSEVSMAMAAREKLAGQGIQARVVSLPSWEVFEEQPLEYRDAVLPPDVKARVAVEAAASFGWHRYVGDAGAVIGLDHFGASAPGEIVLREFGFTPENVVATATRVLKQTRS
jgi:transketolase